jgi:hypothetical protein
MNLCRNVKAVGWSMIKEIAGQNELADHSAATSFVGFAATSQRRTKTGKLVG